MYLRTTSTHTADKTLTLASSFPEYEVNVERSSSKHAVAVSCEPELGPLHFGRKKSASLWKEQSTFSVSVLARARATILNLYHIYTPYAIEGGFSWSWVELDCNDGWVEFSCN